MRIRKSLIVQVLAFAILCVSQRGYAADDPFKSRIPEKQVPVEKSAVVEDNYGDVMTEISKIALEGIVWNSAFAAIIVNGDVYSKGDTIKELNAKILDIQKGKVTILYKGKKYILSKDS